MRLTSVIWFTRWESALNPTNTLSQLLNLQHIYCAVYAFLLVHKAVHITAGYLGAIDSLRAQMADLRYLKQSNPNRRSHIMERVSLLEHHRSGCRSRSLQSLRCRVSESTCRPQRIEARQGRSTQRRTRVARLAKRNRAPIG